jgi:hypothetical protein
MSAFAHSTEPKGGYTVAYMLQGSRNTLLGLEANDDHALVSYAVRVSPTTRGRWATVTCLCGAAARAMWEDTTTTYRSLVLVAWFDACGSTVRLDAESLQRSQE